MKLLNTFKQQLSVFDTIERVWLTSFTIDIEFIETYVLPAIADFETTPQLRMDYEALQLVLNELDADIRVFCDKRYMGENLNKRTLLPVHGVSPGKGGGIMRKGGITEESLFHAKVIYIEGKKNGQRHRVLGAGSANLTLSGWGRNREVFHFLPLDERELYESTQHFFETLFENVGEMCPLKAHRSFPRVNRRARFCHSFQEMPFVHQLFHNNAAIELAVWSPYLSRDLSRFTQQLKAHLGQQDLTLQLVPHRVDNQYLRSAWSQGVAEQLRSGELKLYNLPHTIPRDKNVLETHAKLWRAGSSLAIGSWNATRSGANIRHDAEGNWLAGNNIEAGLITNDKTPLPQYLGSPLDHDQESLFADEEQLQQDALWVPEVPPFDLQVRFNWAKLSYEKVTGIWNPNWEKSDRYTLHLPDVERSIALRWKGNKLQAINSIVVSSPRQLLTDHCYQIQCDGELCYTGLILEEGRPYRRAQRYATLESLLDAYVQPGPEPAADDIAYRVTDSENGELVVDGQVPGEPEYGATEPTFSGTSYFRLFLASYQYAARLRQLAERPSKRHPLWELEHWVFARPGSLEEWVHKARERIEQQPPGIFEWFLVKEVQGLSELAQKLRKKIGASHGKVPASRWAALHLPEPRLPEGSSPAYIHYLEHQYQRMQREWGSG
mgnify:CR=1 FL=1